MPEIIQLLGKIGAFGAIIGLLALLYNWYKDRRRLTVSVASNVLIDTHSLQKDNLKVFLGDREIGKLYSHDYVISNTGKRDLSASDLDSPIVLDSRGAILEARVQEGPRGVLIEKTSDTKAVLSIELFKKGETIRLSILTSSDKIPALDIRAKDFAVKLDGKPLASRTTKFLWEMSVAVIALCISTVAIYTSTLGFKDGVLEPGGDFQEANLKRIRSLAGYVKERFGETKLIDSFSNIDRPNWANSDRQVLVWDGSEKLIPLSNKLKEEGIRVSVSKSLIGKTLESVSKEETFFVITSTKYRFDYTQLTVGNLFK